MKFIRDENPFAGLHEQTKQNLSFWFARRLVRLKRGDFRGWEHNCGSILIEEAAAILDQLQPDTVEQDKILRVVEREAPSRGS